MKFYPYISDRFIILMRRAIIIMKDFIGHILLFISAVVYILLFRHGSSEGDIRTVIVLYWEQYSFLNLWCYVWDDKQSGTDGLYLPGDGYIYYSSIIVKTDVITGLMNRQSYEGRIPYVSVGSSRFDPDKNDCESCVKEADLQMYEWKQRSKEERKNS